MHYGMGGYGCGYGYTAPCAYPGFGYNNWFALIVVLFILLIIIGASCYGK
ncbi:YjcZ family sporulation protein [Neobacillus sp. LXY-4]